MSLNAEAESEVDREIMDEGKVYSWNLMSNITYMF